MKTTTWEIVYICSGKGDYEPEGRYRHEVSFDGKQIYVLGGGTADLAYDLQYVPAFNLEKKIWNKLSTFRDRNKGNYFRYNCNFSLKRLVIRLPSTKEMSRCRPN